MKATPPVDDRIVEEDYFSPILSLCDICSNSSNEEYLTTHTTESLQQLKCNDCEFEPNLTGCLRTHKVGRHGFDEGKVTKLFKCSLLCRDVRHC